MEKLDLETDVRDSNTYDYLLKVDPYLDVGTDTPDCYAEKLCTLCPTFVWCCRTKTYEVNVAFFDLEDRHKLKEFLHERGLWYSLERILRAHPEDHDCSGECIDNPHLIGDS